ncbi:hypothetical protein LX59_01584 [Azomonas agilis]|uniref:Uncharacterized protein n=1 Tax=Azomonas agilis TaxID=116849 RepID=A0A562IJU9_9GAMM|nr:hypothetical protein [Azomonas agilis]TWH71301.1 hypothetical protein LX59_01584 [Azomonas agilis]
MLDIPTLPPRKSDLEDKVKRFYMFAPTSVVLALQKEAAMRGTDSWNLGGIVIAQWLAAGCPDQIVPLNEIG